MAPAVAVTGLRKTYAGGVEALKGITLEIAAWSKPEWASNTS